MLSKSWQRRGLAVVVVVGAAGAGFVGGFVAGRASHGSETPGAQTLIAVPVITQPSTEFVADLAVAARTLRAHGLRLGSVCRVTNEFQGGFLDQFPVVGHLVPRGTAIELLVSNGLRPDEPPGCYDKWKARG
jgi:hypothetical protein